MKTERSGPTFADRAAPQNDLSWSATDDIRLDPDDPDVLQVAHRAVDRLVRAALRLHGPMPTIGTPEWMSGPWVSQAATIGVLGLAWLVNDPDRMVRQRLREMSGDLSGAMDWRAFANCHVTHRELMRRRYPPTGDRDLWVRYGPVGPPAEGVTS